MTTLEQLQAYLSEATVKTVGEFQYKPPQAPIKCADGSTMSVQASEMHYCTPRDNQGPWTHVEVWYCGSPERFAKYGDGSEPYGYLPIELVVEEIDSRGGLDKMFVDQLKEKCHE